MMSTSTTTTSTSFAFGITSALVGQLLMTIGFYIWDNHWTGSAFALNMFKCNMASIGFLILTLISLIYTTDNDRGSTTSSTSTTSVFTLSNIGYLFLSSTIGIVIGDIIWLQALQLLGAKRVILMDSLKPFLAALFGWWLLNEELQPAAFAGVATTIIGVVIVSFENVTFSEKELPSAINVDIHDNNENDCDSCNNGVVDSNKDNSCEDITGANNEVNEILATTTNNDSRPSNVNHHTTGMKKSKEKCWNNSNLVKGTVMSIINIIFDTYGAVLIKQHGIEMTVWEINLIRFGFAGVVMTLISIIMLGRVYCHRSVDQSPTEQSTRATVTRQDTVDIEVISNVTETINGKHSTPWFALPIGDEQMTKASWFRVCVGTVFVTFLTPMLTNYALFQVALALALTLGSTGPLYSLFLSYLMPKSGHQRTFPSARSVIGTLTAVTGIIVLAFFGMVPDKSHG